MLSVHLPPLCIFWIDPYRHKQLVSYWLVDAAVKIAWQWVPTYSIVAVADDSCVLNVVMVQQELDELQVITGFMQAAKRLKS